MFHPLPDFERAFVGIVNKARKAYGAVPLQVLPKSIPEDSEACVVANALHAETDYEESVILGKNARARAEKMAEAWGTRARYTRVCRKSHTHDGFKDWDEYADCEEDERVTHTADEPPTVQHPDNLPDLIRAFDRGAFPHLQKEMV